MTINEQLHNSASHKPGGFDPACPVCAKTMAYLVFHDGFDGSMEVWMERDLETARAKAARLQDRLDNMGYEECGCYRAYDALPKLKVWKMHDREHAGGIAGEVGR